MDFIAKNLIVGVFLGLMCVLFVGLKWLAKKFKKKEKRDLRTREEKQNRFN